MFHVRRDLRRRSAFASLCALGFMVTAGCSREQDTAKARRPVVDADAPNVLIITLDTMRPDRLGCYGYEQAQTPALDALAASGVRFAEAYCHVPLTLPSHVSLFTGRYPLAHGIHVNAGGVLSEQIPTMGEAFEARGYRTAAFVAAWVLNETYGLGRGFELYDDESQGQGELDKTTQERPADEVCDAAIAWLEANREHVWFVWVHFYDAHIPYRPPAPYRDRFEDPYDGEIAFVDDQISRLTGWLQSRGLRDKTLVVAVGDHGEAFGEHGEREHGMLLYDTTMQVPMIFSWPGTLSAGTVVQQGGRVIDVLPTVAALLGWDQPGDMDGANLASSCHTGRGQFLSTYAETMYPLVGFGWAPLRSLITDQYKFIDAPAPELYERRADAAEERNLAMESRDLTERLRAELSELRGRIEEHAPAAPVLDAESLSKLHALGYFGAPVLPDDEEPGEGRRDPKDMMFAFRGMLRAEELIQAEQPAEAVRLLEPIVRLTPESDAVWSSLGEAYLKLGEYEKARQALLKGLRTVPGNPSRLCQVGDTYRNQGNIAKAIEYYNKAIEASQDFGEAYARLGDIYLEQGDVVRARRFILRHVEVDPDSPNALTNLGSLHHRSGAQREALRLLRQALQHDPRFAPAHRTIWRVLMALGRGPEAIQALRTARDLFPEEKEFTHVLVLMLAAGPRATPETVAEALEMVKTCCPPGTTDPQHFDALACALAAAGDFPRAAEAAAHAMNLAQRRGDAAFAAQLAQRAQLYQQGRMPTAGGRR